MGLDLGFVSFDSNGFHLKNPISGESLIDWNPMDQVNAFKNQVTSWMDSISRVLQEALGSFFGGIRSLVTDVLMKGPATIISAVGGGLQKAFKKGGQ